MVVKKFSDRFFLLSVTFVFFMFFLTCNAAADIEDHITRTETGFYYTIQKGDTLWDLSREFSNSPWVWPEMWHYNPQIKNPHLIYPGQNILVYKKEWEGKETAEPVVEQPLEKIQTYHTFTDIERVGFIRKKAVDHLGTIFKTHDNVKLISTGTLVYIHPEPGSAPLSIGNQYTIFRAITPVKDVETNEDYGVQHFLTGVVEITSIEPEFATGRIVTAYRDILVNDRLMPYEQRSVDIPIKKSKQSFSARIIKPEEHSSLIGQATTVFINKGEHDGIQPGQFYSIYLQESARPDPDQYKETLLTPYLIGELIVLHAEKTTATALITKSKQQITPGNIVRTLEVAGN